MSKNEKFDPSREAAEATPDYIGELRTAGECATGLAFMNSTGESHSKVAQPPQSPLPSIKGYTPDRVKDRMKDLK